MFELHMQVQLRLGCIMPQLHIIVGERLIPIAVLLILVAQVQLVVLVLLQDRV